MAYFGRRFDAPIYEGAPRTMTPTAVPCVWCEQMILLGDDGFQYVSGEFTHALCNLRQMIGEPADEIYAAMVARYIRDNMGHV